jgi:hypothetical protein
MCSSSHTLGIKMIIQLVQNLVQNVSTDESITVVISCLKSSKVSDTGGTKTVFYVASEEEVTRS